MSPSLRELRASLLEDRSLTGTAWCERWARTADAWLGQLFEAAAGGRPGLALLAVGGYGRGSLAPGSDLDLLLVHDGKRRPADLKALADALWYPVWDSGLPLDHSVRTVKETRALMDADSKVAMGLLDARRVVGDEKLADAVLERAIEMWRTRAAKWLPPLDELTVERHHRFGDLAFLLEPDVKEARGGLRDLQLLLSLAAVIPVVGSDPRLDRAREILTAVRVELQRPNAQATNVLLLQDQDAVAERLGCADADVLMSEVADAARSIAWASDDGWRRIRSWLAGPRGRGGGGDQVIEPALVVRDGEVALLAGADPAVDPSLALRAAAASASLDLPMSRGALDRLASRAMGPDGAWAPATLQAFLRLLGAGRTAIAAIESLDQAGVWMRYLPEWEPVRNRPQRNAYHRFTVDRHLLETVALAAARQGMVSRPDLLLLGSLFHDIGKGRDGDHTEIGIEVVAELGARMGLSTADTELLQDLVRHHLLLPDVATRRDLGDPATAAFVASRVGDRLTLELLAVLAEADGLATGPAAWGGWKAGLISQLVDQVRAVLSDVPVTPRTPTFTPEEQALLAGHSLELLADGGRVTVCSADRTGLLALVAGVFTLAGVNVRSAATLSDPDRARAVLRFEVAPAFDALPDWSSVRQSLEAALGGRLDVDAALHEREAHYARIRRSVSAYPAEPRVLIDHEASEVATVIEVRAPDTGPVLYKVAHAISECGVDITRTLISTLGAEAIDVFYVQGTDGGRVTDPASLSNISAAVLAAVGG